MDVHDKIAKLLALSNSPEEEEAKAALLKARALMVKYKIREDEVPSSKDCKIINQMLDGITCTTLTDPWIDTLSSIIADFNCCKSFRSRFYRGKKATIGFVGLEKDFNICKKAFLYAYHYVDGRCRKIRKNKSRSVSANRNMANAYGQGFCIGLQKAYQKQQEQHQEWGLVLQTPQVVLDAMNNFKKGKNFDNNDYKDLECRAYFQKGYQDGMDFDSNPPKGLTLVRR